MYVSLYVVTVFYISSLLSVKKGSSPDFPGVSCKDIRKSTNAQNNGEYWIDPKGTGLPFKVYCDMKTDGGKFCPVVMSFWRCQHYGILAFLEEHFKASCVRGQVTSFHVVSLQQGVSMNTKGTLLWWPCDGFNFHFAGLGEVGGSWVVGPGDNVFDRLFPNYLWPLF